MATISFSSSLNFTVFVVFLFMSISADPGLIFSFNGFDEDVYLKDSTIGLHGDAEVMSNGSSIQLTYSVSSSAGIVMYKKPIKIVEGNTGQLASFSTRFTFSLSNDEGDGLAFVMFRRGYNNGNRTDSRIIAIKFDDAHVGIDASGLKSASVRNSSAINSLGLKNGEKLKCWIDFEAGSKRLEVRIGNFVDSKPVNPLLSYPIELWKMLGGKEVFVGISSANMKSNQTCFLYSWSAKVRHVPHWIHSRPLDPETMDNKVTVKPLVFEKRGVCIFGSMIIGVACGALGAIVVLYLWAVCRGRRRTPVVPEDFAAKNVDFDSKKLNVIVVVGKTVEDGKKLDV